MSVTTSTTKGALVKVRKYTYVRAEPELIEEKQPASVRIPRVRVKERAFSTMPAVVLALTLITGWYISTASGYIPGLLLPTPVDVFTSLATGIGSGMYLNMLLVTVQESVFGFLLALLVALPLGYGLVKSRLLSHAVQPYLVAGQAIPAIVIAPLFVLWLGYGVIPTMLICMLVVLFPMVMNTVLGIQTIDHTVLDAARVEGAVGWPLLLRIEFPLALPAVLTAIRTGFTLSITGALVGEMVSGGDQGLGSLVLLALHQYNPPFMFATLIVLAILAACYYSATWLLVRLADAIY